jgi:hypothetical protein
MESDDSDLTEYNDVNDAVANHTDTCLRLLAAEWGLEYSFLPGNDVVLGKRKPESDSSYDAAQSVIWRDEDGRMLRQDRKIRIEATRPIEDTRGILDQDPPISEHGQVSVTSMKIEWRAGSRSTDGWRIRDTGRYANQPQDET